MKAITRFTLETHAGPYERWPLRSRLLCDGQPTDLRLLGYSLSWQFELENRILLITDYDCPFEEAYEIYLLSNELRVLSRASDPPRLALLGIMAGALSVSSRNLYCRAEIIDGATVRLLGCSAPPHLQITVRHKRSLGFGSLLHLQFVG